MAVAWIGSQDVQLSSAIQEAARLLAASNRAVFSLDSDVHGTRAAITLAERLGATYDHVNGSDVLGQIELCTDRGGFFITPSEVRRRADIIIFVGEIPEIHRELIASWTSYEPDLTPVKHRKWFHLQSGISVEKQFLSSKLKGKKISAPEQSLGALLNLIRASLASRQVSVTVPEIKTLVDALNNAHFPVFVYSSGYGDGSSIAALQGLVKDINKTGRASSLFLPADDGAWGTALSSVWMTGFPPRTSFATGKPVYDPVLSDVRRMIAADEADVHCWFSEREDVENPSAKRLPLIATTSSSKPIKGAAVSFAVGKSGIDHDGVVYSSRIGSFRSVSATAPTQLPSVAHIVHQIAQALPGGEGLPC